MKPDSTSGRQDAGHNRPDDTRSTSPDTEIPRENKAYEGVREGPTEDALPRGATEPHYRHRNRPERDKQGGSYKGPTKRR